MAFMQWSDEYKMNVKVIDDQHMNLFEMINKFDEAIRDKKTKQAIAKILQGLAEYTIYHFHSEENLMKLKDYPNYETHRASHQSFIVKVNEFQERINEGKLLIPIEIANFLKEWLSKHILVTDKQLSTFLLRRGLE